MQLQAALPSSQAGLNLIDNSVNSGWTPGAQMIVPLNQDPPRLLNRLTIIGWSIQFTGAAELRGVAPFYGRFGKLIASILTGGSIAPVTAFMTPFTPLPQQALPNAQTVWDGSQDIAPFPTLGSGFTGQLPTQGSVIQSYQLPQPIRLAPSDQIAVGLWLTPSLIQNVGLQIGSTIFNIDVTSERVS